MTFRLFWGLSGCFGSSALFCEFPAVSVIFGRFSGFLAVLAISGCFADFLPVPGDCLTIPVTAWPSWPFGGGFGGLCAIVDPFLVVWGPPGELRWFPAQLCCGSAVVLDLCTVPTGIKLMFTQSQYTSCGVQAINRSPDGFSFLPIIAGLACCLLAWVVNQSVLAW